jgi:hypothetical protein
LNALSRRMPALQTRISTRPQVFIASSMVPAAAASSETEP